jgi:hypothetical protein
MLDIPGRGFQRSVNAHNVGLQAMCDWIEACVLFSEERVSQRDIVDVLVEKQIYAEQDFAQQRVEDAWTTLRNRAKLLGDSPPYRFETLTLFRDGDTWKDNAPYAFLLTLSLAEHYPAWASTFGVDFTDQGELFEKLLEHSLTALFPGWKVLRTGWSRSQTNTLTAIVKKIAEQLHETQGEVEKWTSDSAKEAGLDVLIWRPFEDAKGAYPAYLVQCASGRDWKKKLGTPNLLIWTRVVDWRSRGLPRKALAMPFVLEPEEFTKYVNQVDGLLLDRLRIVAAAADNNQWVPKTLLGKLRQWGSKRANKLPKFD